MGQINSEEDEHRSELENLEPRRRLRRVVLWTVLGVVSAASFAVLFSVVKSGLAPRSPKVDAPSTVHELRFRRAAGTQSVDVDDSGPGDKNEGLLANVPGRPEETETDVVVATVAGMVATEKTREISKLRDEANLLEQALTRRPLRFSGQKGKQQENKKPSSRVGGHDRQRDLGGRMAALGAELEAGNLSLPGTLSESEEVGLFPTAAPEVSVGGDELQAAKDFLEKQGRLDGVAFLDASGYWSNAYVPGDPAFRLLQARMLGGEGSTLTAAAPSRLRLHEAARRTWQPFDPPTQAALAVYLHAEERAVDQERRMLMQVGLQATNRRSGLRPAMNVALVLDLREPIDPESAAAMRAVVMALAEAKDLGDRFRLLVAGCPGGELVEPEEFRHGSLILAMDQIFGLGGSVGSCADLTVVLETAVEGLSRGDDPHGPLGSSVVLLVTASPLGTLVERLDGLAHESAVSGIPWSVVGVGDEVERQELDHLALAGQGNRRLLRSASEAAGLIDRELSAVSRVVARALRLRIRLATGVELVEILGSQRLDELRAEGVRESERSIDLRLARNLGIEADRGEDEEGIQIVIPSFYAGDSHVVLLDVVVPGPGPVADVTVRYKDLVYLKNGVTRDNLSLHRGTVGPGPLEVNVTKNLLAFRLFEVLEAAAEAVARGDLPTAEERLLGYRQLLAGLREEVPGLEHDPDIATDLAMLGDYLWFLDPERGPIPEHHAPLVDSLRYAGRLKILPPPPRVGDRS